MKQTYNYQQPIQKTKSKQTTRIGTESQKWRSCQWLSAGEREKGGNGTGNKKHKW